MDDNTMVVDDNSDGEAYDSDHPAFITPEVQLNNGVDSGEEEEEFEGVADDCDDITVLRSENKRLAQEVKEFRRLFEQTNIQISSLKREHQQCKKKLRQAINRVGNGAAPQVDDETIEKITRWKEPMIQSAMKIKQAVGVNTYKLLISQGELQLPSVRTITRYMDSVRKAGGDPNSFEFTNNEDGDESENEIETPAANNNNQRGGSNEYMSDNDDPVSFTAVPDISYYQHDDDDDEDASNANDVSLMGDSFAGQGNAYGTRTLSQAHLEFLKTMVGYRKKWTPYEIKTSTEIRRIIGSKEYEVLRKQEGMPLPSVKTLRKYKRCAIENGDDNVNSATLRPEKSTKIRREMPLNNSNEFEENDDVLAFAEEPEGHFDINSLSEEQIDFLQSMSGNNKGFSDYELQRSLELKNELGPKDYEILRKQECLHIPTLSMLNKYEKDHGLEEAASGIFPDLASTILETSLGDNSVDQEDQDDANGFDMNKLAKHHIQFLNTLPENPKRWTEPMIDSAFDLKQSIGTKDYENLRKQGVPLPAARTLRRHKEK